MSIGRQYRQYLLSEGFTDVYLNYMPESPDEVICVFDEAAPVLTVSEGLNAEQSGIEVLVRSDNPGNAEQTIEDIHDVTIGFRNATFEAGGRHIVATYLNQEPSYVDRDSESRVMWSAHYVVRNINETQFRS